MRHLPSTRRYPGVRSSNRCPKQRAARRRQGTTDLLATVSAGCEGEVQVRSAGMCTVRWENTSFLAMSGRRVSYEVRRSHSNRSASRAPAERQH